MRRGCRNSRVCEPVAIVQARDGSYSNCGCVEGQAWTDLYGVGREDWQGLVLA